VESAEAGLTCVESKKCVVRFSLACQNAAATALLFARLVRSPTNPAQWTFTAVGAGVKTPSFAGLIPQVQEKCRDVIPTIVPEPAGSIVLLVKGEAITFGPLSKVTVGLGWDTGRSRIDLDASVLAFARNGDCLATVYFSTRTAFDGNIKHTGDNTSGAGDGDDETIICQMDKLPDEVAALGVTVNSFRGQPFTQVRNAYVRLLDSAGGEICRYPLSGSSTGTAYVMATIFRPKGVGSIWSMRAHGIAGNGSSVQACKAALSVLAARDCSDGDRRLDDKARATLDQFSKGVVVSNSLTEPAGCCGIL